jgi:alpha-1,2-mannosyltransferase
MGRSLDNDNDSRPRPSDTAWFAAGALVLFGAGILCAFWMLHPYPNKWLLIDLDVYRAAGRAIIHRHSVYGPYVRDQLRIPLPFIYPPIAAVLAIPFTALPLELASWLWTAITVVSLAVVVRVSFAKVLDRYGRAMPIALGIAVLATAALAPVEDHLRFGQVGIPLMALCVVDCATPKPKWPRGMLVGLATAFKLVPGIFIPYLALTRRGKAARVAIATFIALSIGGFVFAFSDSWKFWTNKMFEPTSPEFFTNQSLEGMLVRVGGPWRLFWLAAIAVVLVFGLWRAAAASIGGDELRGIAITGMVGVLVSPISWIHHLVWIIPALGVILGKGTDRKRVIATFLLAAAFVARVPYVGNDELHGTGLLAALLEDTYGFVCLGVFVYLTDAIPLARTWLVTKRTEARSRATTPAPGH